MIDSGATAETELRPAAGRVTIERYKLTGLTEVTEFAGPESAGSRAVDG
jgi:hypothetical protein